MRKRTIIRPAIFGVSVLLVVACNSKADDVCENVGACEQNGNSDAIKSCQDEAKALLQTAEAVGCDGFFANYYRCADDNFTCEGATASFPGCDAKRVNLDDCLARQQSNTACTELARKTAPCVTVDASAAPAPARAPAPAPACTAARDCAARCYLDHVVEVCAPRPDEIAAVGSCSQSCPP